MFDPTSRFIKPLIHPRRIWNETIEGYLVRLANLNGYSRVSWLFEKGTGVPNYADLVNWTEWCQPDFELEDPFSDMKLNHGCRNTQRMHYCPACLELDGYWKSNWQIEGSFVCLVDNIWLHDVCSECGERFGFNYPGPRTCRCGADFVEAERRRPAEEVLRLQAYLERSDVEGSIISDRAAETTIEFRVDLVRFFRKWHYLKYTVDPSLERPDDIEFESIRSTAEALFAGELGFSSFLHRLLSLSPESNHAPFRGFYRQYLAEFSEHPSLQYVTHLLEEFMHVYWRHPLSGRSSLFSTETREAHPWVPFGKVAKKFNLTKRALEKAMNDRLIRFEERTSETGRRMIVLFEPDVESRLPRLRDELCAVKAARYLGVSKRQLNQLREDHVLLEVKPPSEDDLAKWQYSKRELDSLLLHNTEIEETIPPGLLSFHYVTRLISPRVHHPISVICRAILFDHLTPIKQEADPCAVRFWHFNKHQVLEWYKRFRCKARLSVLDASEILGINQEFTYQLVNQGYIHSVSDHHHKWMEFSDLELFNRDYVILAKLAIQTEQSSRGLINILNKYSIDSADHRSKVKLRQKLYHRVDLVKVSELHEALKHEPALKLDIPGEKPSPDYSDLLKVVPYGRRSK
jgi:hypothetical protein